jgi:hypothetical protein
MEARPRAEHDPEDHPSPQVTQENWEELRQQGVEHYLNVSPLSTEPTVMSDIIRVAGERAADGNVLVGEGYDWREKRPLKHLPEVGVYIRRAK